MKKFFGIHTDPLNTDFDQANILYKKYKQNNKQDRHEEILELKKVCNILDSLNIKNWLDFGTLLGMYRDQNLIPHDNDIDISIVLDSDEVMYTLVEKLSDHYYIKHYEVGYISIYPKNNPNFGYQHIDIYRYKEDINKKLIKYICWPECKLRNYFINELLTLKYKDIIFNIPNHTEDYIKMFYGTDYKTISKEFHGTDPDKNKDYNFNEQVKVYITGVFDLFHIGHVNILKKCKKYFDNVIVGIHNDEIVQTYKPKPIIPYNQRLEVLKSCKYVDQIIENADINVDNSFLDTIGAKFLVYGREETIATDFYKVTKDRIHIFERTEQISTTIIKNNII